MMRKEKWFFDGHIDMGEALLYFGCNPLIEGNGIEAEQHLYTPNSVDIPRLKKGGAKLFAASIFTFHLKDGAKDHDFKSPHRWSTELRRYQSVYQGLVDKSEGGLMLIKNIQDLDRCLDTDVMGMFFTVEGVNGVRKKGWERDLEFAKDMGVISIGGWNLRSKLWEPHSVIDGKGLTDAGKDFIITAAELGIAIDLSHMGNRAADKVLELLPEDKIVMFTHSNCHALKDHSRNARDQQLIAVYRRGGTNGNTFSSSFHKKDGVGSVNTYLDHFDHHLSLGIIESSTIASDFYGLYIPSATPGLDDATTAYANIERGLLARGHSQSIVDGIAFGNGERTVRRVLTARS